MAAPAEFLLIDNSNSFTKFALSSRSSLASVRKLRTAGLTVAKLQAAFGSWRFNHAILSSVVPKKAEILQQWLGATPTLHVSAKVHLGVGIDYPKPKSIGADRLANAASAAAFYGSPVIVVDFGTAVSFDIISKEGNYVGGVIAPGLEAMTDYLHDRTALLPKITLLEPPAAIGKSTRKAMLAGAVYGYRGLVRGILNELQAELGGRKKAKVVATGGYSDLIAAGLPEIDAIRPDLTLQGLRIIGTLNTEEKAES